MASETKTPRPQIIITVYFEARKILGKKSVTAHGRTVLEVLENFLAELSSDQRQAMLTQVFENMRFQSRKYNILLNGRNIKLLEGVQSPVQPGDEIVIVPAIGGG